MKFLNGIFGRKGQDEVGTTDTRLDPFPADIADTPAAKNTGAVDMFDMMASDDADDASQDTIDTVIDTMGKPRKDAVNIWDMDGEQADPAPEAAPAVAAPDRASSRARRNRTRLIGFDKSDGDVVDLFNEDSKTAPTERVQFPVGWVLVVAGPGRGHCFAITAGMAQIGRAEDQAIQLDFGDTAISRNNHAAIVFDPEAQQFLLGHGGKANIVRLNGKPVISNEDLADGDIIAIGDTELQLKTLVGPDFNWDAPAQEEDLDDDVAIA